MLKWAMILVEAGRKIKTFLIIFLVGLSGIGPVIYIFSGKDNTHKIYDRKIDLPKNIIDGFFNGDTNNYIVHLGWYYEGDKCGIVPSDQRINKAIQDHFSTNQKFDNKKLEDFLLKHKISPKELWKHFARVLVATSVKDIFILTPDFSPVSKYITSPQNISLSGMSCNLKPDVVKVSRSTDQQVKYFLENKFLEKTNYLMQEELRSGYLIKIPTKNISFSELETHTQNLSHKTITQLLKNPKLNAQKEYYENMTSSSKTNGRLLFDDPEWQVIGDYYVFPIVEHIQPITFKTITKEDWEKYRDLCDAHRKQVEELCLLEQYSYDFNKTGKMSDAMKQNCIFKPMSHNAEYFSMNLAKIIGVVVGKSSVFKNIDSQYTIFICQNRTAQNQSGLPFPKEMFNQLIYQDQINLLLSKFWIDKSVSDQ